MLFHHPKIFEKIKMLAPLFRRFLSAATMWFHQKAWISSLPPQAANSHSTFEGGQHSFPPVYLSLSRKTSCSISNVHDFCRYAIDDSWFLVGELQVRHLRRKDQFPLLTSAFVVAATAVTTEGKGGQNGSAQWCDGSCGDAIKRMD